MKNLILIGLAFSALSLIGCSKSDEDKCKEDSNKEWVNGECKDKAAALTQEQCDADATTIWKEDKCQDKTQEECTDATTEWKEDKCQLKAAALTQEQCDADATKAWKEDKCQDKIQAECTDATTEWKEDKCQLKASAAEEEEAYYYVSKSSTAIKFNSADNASASLTSADECAKVTKSQLATLKVSTLVDDRVLCDNSDENPYTNCAEKNYEIQDAVHPPTGSRYLKLAIVLAQPADTTQCKALTVPK